MINVGVLFGSRSVEHEVSVITALQAIYQLVDNREYKIVPIYISKTGDWYTGDLLFDLENFKDLNKIMSGTQKVTPIKQDQNVYLIKSPLKKITNNIIERIDLALPILHGTFGEDGTLQGLFEQLGLPFGGCNVLSAAVTMDKIMTKLILKASNIPVVDFVWFNIEDWFKKEFELVGQVETQLGYPVVVKPADIGSSVGISVANNKKELKDGVNFVRKFSERVLIERYVSNLKEVNISVLGDCESHRLSVCEEPITSHEILTYADKYAGGNNSKGSKGGTKDGAGSAGMSSLSRKIPANISDKMKLEIEHLASISFKTLDCSGVSRIDFIIDGDTDDVYVNEFNTIPGSLSFYLWEATGVSFAELLDELIKIAKSRYRRRSMLTFTNEVNILANANIGSKGGSKN
jgi:D-alanine-D-alanine ligase